MAYVDVDHVIIERTSSARYLRHLSEDMHLDGYLTGCRQLSNYAHRLLREAQSLERNVQRLKCRNEPQAMQEAA